MIRLPRRRARLPRPPVGSAADGSADAIADESRAGSRPDSPDSAGAVRGERGASLVSGARSLQARMSSLLAAGLMTVVGATMLFWYYAEALSRPAAARAHTHGAMAGAAGGGLTLPPFGPVSPPGGALPAGPDSAATSGSAPPVLAATRAPESALAAGPLLEPALARAPGGQRRRLRHAAATLASPTGARPASVGRCIRHGIEGRLARSRCSRGRPGAESRPRRGRRAGTAVSDAGRRRPPAQAAAPDGAGRRPGRKCFRANVCCCRREPSSTARSRRRSIRRCPGMTTCVTATDTFSADGTVVLLERGTKLIGETRGEVRQGQARVFVVWTRGAHSRRSRRARSTRPAPMRSGASGLEGKVDRHFWERFGAAALVSTIDGAVQSEVQSSSRGGTVVLDPSASEDVLTGILRSTVDIPPTVTGAQRRAHSGAGGPRCRLQVGL